MRKYIACLIVLCMGAAPSPDREPLPLVAANDNRTPAGALRDGVLMLDLVATMARWYPEAMDGPFAELPVFAEEGKTPTIPGPLVRVRRGTRVRLSVRNGLTDSTLTLLGYGVTRAGDTTAVRLAPGARADDRVMVLNIWSAMSPDSSWRTAIAINGKSWPFTERMDATVGDTLRWRVVNATVRVHPMHLHGAYFRVDARGDATSDTVYTRPERRMAVTELMDPRSTMFMTWSPETPGNWLFHCHLAFHVIASARLDAREDDHTMHSTDPAKHMAGLVMGIHVRPRGVAAARRNVRRLSVAVAPGIAKDTAHPRPIALRLTPDGRLPAPANVSIRGDLILLTRGEPTDITVHNGLSEPTAIHWHGLELESYSDGVVGFSGDSTRLAPPIAASDSFVARLTLKRAGTFIYHTHLNDLEQIGAGLYGPLIVLAPGQRWDPKHDLVLTGGYDLTATDEPVINGDETDPPLGLRVGEAVRMRFINIQPADPFVFEVVRDSTTSEWRPVAKDGFDLPPSQAVVGPAKRMLWVGETFDAEFKPKEPGTYRLRAWFSPKDVAYERVIEVSAKP